MIRTVITMILTRLIVASSGKETYCLSGNSSLGAGMCQRAFAHSRPAANNHRRGRVPGPSSLDEVWRSLLELQSQSTAEQPRVSHVCAAKDRLKVVEKQPVREVLNIELSIQRNALFFK